MRERFRLAVERLGGALAYSQPAVGFFGGARGCAWGLWTLTHPDLFNRYPQFFQPLRSVADPWVWGLGTLLFGSLQLWALAVGNRQVRRLCAFFASMGWLGLAWTYYRGDPDSLGIPLLLLDAAAAGWAYIRLGTDYGRPGDGRAP